MKDYCTAILLVLLVGQVSSLALNRQHEAACTSCPAGYSLSGSDCKQNCPAGWASQADTCTFEYGRGIGFPWSFSDGFGNDRGMFARCEARHGAGNCEKYGASVFPKCKAGYSRAGCCICRQVAPNCGAAGLNSGSGLFCNKKVTTC